LRLAQAFDMVPEMDLTEAPVQSCPDCAAQMPAGAQFCPACGRSMLSLVRAQGRVGHLPEYLAGTLAYFTFLPAIVFLLVEPYRKSVFTRFHSLQSLFLSAAVILLVLALKIAGLALFAIPVLGPLLVVLVDVVAGLAALFVWLVAVVNAFQGDSFKIPVVGDFAEHYAGVFRAAE
jgi:uncharacterized membrane protein